MGWLPVEEDRALPVGVAQDRGRVAGGRVGVGWPAVVSMRIRERGRGGVVGGRVQEGGGLGEHLYRCDADPDEGTDDGL